MLWLRVICCQECERWFCLCTSCDRGQRYCSQACSSQARQAGMRAAGAKYQRTEKGRHHHAERQRRYRARKRAGASVTHQGGSASEAAEAMVAPVPEAPMTVSPGDPGGATESADATRTGELRGESMVEADPGEEDASQAQWRSSQAAVGGRLHSLGAPGRQFVARCARCGRRGWLWREPGPAFGD